MAKNRVENKVSLDNPDISQPNRKKIKNKIYEKVLAGFQVELVKLQKWIKDKGLKVVVIFEGRDAAGKGGSIRRITQSLNPRICRVVALGDAHRARENAMVLPTLRRSPPDRGRDGSLRSKLVQPGGRRAGDGVLYRGGVSRVPPFRTGVRAHAGSLRRSGHQVLVLGER